MEKDFSTFQEGETLFVDEQNRHIAFFRLPRSNLLFHLKDEWTQDEYDT